LKGLRDDEAKKEALSRRNLLLRRERDYLETKKKRKESS